MENRILTVTSFLLVAFAGSGCGGSGDQETSAGGSVDVPKVAAASATVLDPVCGVWVDPTSAPTVDRAGASFGFCSVAHKTEFDANADSFWTTHKTQGVNAQGYLVQMHLVGMSAYKTITASQGVDVIAASPAEEMASTSDVGSHHLTVGIIDAKGQHLSGVVVTVKTTWDDGAEGKIVQATSGDENYTAALQMAEPGNYIIEASFSAPDGRRRMAMMRHTQS